MSSPRPLRIVVLDATERRAPWLSLWWRLGAAVSGADAVVRAGSWDEAYRGISRALADLGGRALDLQIWGHGDDGRPLIDGGPVSLHALHAALGILPKDSTVWWRSCEVHRGPRGQRFAEDAVRILGCVSVGHCVVVSAPNPLRQGAICALRQGQRPWWPPDGAGLRGCSTLRMAVPRWAYR